MQNQTWQFRWPFFFFFFFFLSSSFFITELSIGRKMMMMVPSKAKTRGDLKVSRLNRNGSTKSDAQRSSSPLPKLRGSVDRPTKSFASKASSKNSTSAPSKPGLQGKLEAVEVELKKAREQLRSVEQEKIKALEHMNEAKRLMNEEVEKAEEIAEELRRVKEELRGAEAEKEMALREVDDAKRAAKVHGEKAELASKEACDSKALHESELGSVHRESREMIEKLEAEIGMLKLELERAKIAEEKLVHMESLVEKLQIEATDARNGESDVCALVDEWRNKAERLKADLEEAHQSENSASDSLADMMVKLEESKSLFQDAEMEISILRARINTLEIDLEESNRQLELAQQDALNIGKTVELLKLELQRLEEEKLEASSRIQRLAEENDTLTAELKLSKDEGEKANKATERLALEFKAMAIGAREREERLTRMQTEIEESHKEIDHLSRALRNTEERYEVMLDEARYELVCLHKRCKDEQNFISTHEKNESIEDVEQANSSPDEEEPSKNENSEPSETILDEENEVQSSELWNTEVEDHCQEGHDMNGTTNGKVDPMKIMDDGLGLEEEAVDDDLDSKMNSNGVDHTNRTEQHRLRRKKKALLYSFGILLKKGNH